MSGASAFSSRRAAWRRAARGARPSRPRARRAPEVGPRPGTAIAAPNEPGLPSQFTNVPAFSATAETGSTTSARSVTALTRSSRLTTNCAASRASSAAAGSGRSAGSTPAMTRAPISRAAVAARICKCHGPARTAVRRSPCPRHLGPGRLVGDQPAARQHHGQGAGLDRAALAGPARHPGQLGTGLLGQPGRCGQRAGNLGQPLAGQDHRARLPQRVRHRGPGLIQAAAACQPAKHLGFLAGHGRQQRAGHQRQPGAGQRGDRVHRERPGTWPPCAAAGRGSATRPAARTRPAAPPACSRLA